MYVFACGFLSKETDRHQSGLWGKIVILVAGASLGWLPAVWATFPILFYPSRGCPIIRSQHPKPQQVHLGEKSQCSCFLALPVMENRTALPNLSQCLDTDWSKVFMYNQVNWFTWLQVRMGLDGSLDAKPGKDWMSSRTTQETIILHTGTHMHTCMHACSRTYTTLTTIALTIPHIMLYEVLHPQLGANATLCDGVTVTVTWTFEKASCEKGCRNEVIWAKGGLQISTSIVEALNKWVN